MEQSWWNTKVEQWNSGTVLEEQCGGTVEQCWRNRGTVLVEQWNSDGETV